MKPSTKVRAEHLAGMFAEILMRLDNVGSVKASGKAIGKTAERQPGVMAANQ